MKNFGSDLQAQNSQRICKREIKILSCWEMQDAVGAIDGTHVPACPPSGHQMAYTNRHGFQSQNLLAICDFNIRFTYIYAGWEGSAHDAQVLDGALSHPSDFPMPSVCKLCKAKFWFKYMNVR